MNRRNFLNLFSKSVGGALLAPNVPLDALVADAPAAAAIVDPMEEIVAHQWAALFDELDDLFSYTQAKTSPVSSHFLELTADLGRTPKLLKLQLAQFDIITREGDHSFSVDDWKLLRTEFQTTLGGNDPAPMLKKRLQDLQQQELATRPKLLAEGLSPEQADAVIKQNIEMQEYLHEELAEQVRVLQMDDVSFNQWLDGKKANYASASQANAEHRQLLENKLAEAQKLEQPKQEARERAQKQALARNIANTVHITRNVRPEKTTGEIVYQLQVPRQTAPSEHGVGVMESAKQWGARTEMLAWKLVGKANDGRVLNHDYTRGRLMLAVPDASPLRAWLDGQIRKQQAQHARLAG